MAIKGFDFGQRRVFAVDLAEFEQRCRLNRSLEVQMQLRLGELTNEGVGRAEGYGCHLSDCRFLIEVLRDAASSSRQFFPLQFGVLVSGQRRAHEREDHPQIAGIVGNAGPAISLVRCFVGPTGED